MLIHIKGSNLRKNNYIMRSRTTPGGLKEYWEKNSPIKWLFSCQYKEKHITARAIEEILSCAHESAKILKTVAVYSLGCILP